MDTIGYRIKKQRKALKLSVEDLAKKLNKDRATIYRYENGNIENLPITIMRPLANALSTSIEYLMGWETSQEPTTKVSVMKRKIKVIGRIPAGVPFEAIEDVLDEVEIPAWLDRKKELFGLIIEGESMNKIVPNGAIGVFEKTPILENGEIGAINVNGYDATVKKFYQLTDSVVLEPVSYDDTFEPLVIREEPVTVQGKLVWYCTPKNFKF